MKDRNHTAKEMSQWYRDNLMVDGEEVFPYDTSYFSPARSRSTLNFQVGHLAPLLNSLAEKGVRIEDHLEENEFGLFAWVYDPEGNRIELWEPPQDSPINLPEAE